MNTQVKVVNLMLPEEVNKYYEMQIYLYIERNFSTVEMGTKILEDKEESKKLIDANKRIIESKKDIIMKACNDSTLINANDVDIYNKCNVIDAYISLKIQEKAIETMIRSIE